MNKIGIIIAREYLTRVKKRSFLLVTFLVPLLFAGMYALIAYLVLNQNELSTSKKVRVLDQSGLFKNQFKNSAALHFSYSEASPEAAKKDFTKSGSDFLLLIGPFEKEKAGRVELLSEKQANMGTIASISSAMEDIVQGKRMVAAGIDTAALKKTREEINIETRILTESGERNSNSYAAFGAGFLFSLMIYMFIFLYGAQVMRGVIEEKTSRVIEVIISSVRPFQLMMGKIIGLALVGLTQFLLWITLTWLVSSAVGTQMHMGSGVIPGQSGVAVVWEAIGTINFTLILSCFLFYFITGYLLYGALFAAIGSAVDSETETQQFMLPVTLPLIFAFIISLNYVVNNPDSSLSVWLSLIPFFAPVVMMVRLPFNPPAWQIGLSMFMMILGFLLTVWLAARIYRIGILMYGKKTSFRELGKWIFYKD